MKKIVLVAIAIITCQISLGQSKKEDAKTPSVYEQLKWRNIGPFRGGRSVASTGVVKQAGTFYMGSVGGGIWKTTDNGIQWKNVSDGFLNTGTVGAITVSESDPNIVVVGMGEHAARGVMTSMGDGVYKSEDAGKTWKHMGLDNSRHISDVVIHPNNPDLIYVSVQGAQFGPSADRGVYRSTNGGKTWNKVLYVSDTTGASSLSMDMNNPRILYAAMWDHQRKPWQMISGGKGSGLYKSTDGGEHWEQLKDGLPIEFGKSGISVSRANSNVVYANIEAEADKGGVYRSDDGGKKWRQTTKDRITVARSWYYMEVFADPQDENKVYVLNAPVLKSIDGGKTFSVLSTPHGDNHHLWIHPYDNNIMINSNDGGANISLNEAKSWSTQQNQPTAQFYRVIADKQVPYHVYGGQQDNSAIGIKSRTRDNGIDWKDWYSVAGCESAFLAFDPNNPDYVYGGCYQGILDRWNRETGESKPIKEYPELGLSKPAKDFKYRYNWNAPVVSSYQDPSVIYHAGNVVFKSSNGGIDWEPISPDLTKNEKEKQGLGGVPYTNEGAGGENYNTLMSLQLSMHDPNVIWAGSDDGLVHLTKDGGKTWENVTPKKMKEGIVNSIEVSPFDPATTYISLMRYKDMDLTPYIYKTDNFGKSWKLITDGIEGKHTFVRVVRADPKVKGLLYAGSETGMYISRDDGAQWEKWQLNLPVVPINDLYIRDNDLIAATAGRSFWILDDLSPIQQGTIGEQVELFTPKESYRLLGARSSNPTIGTNPLEGVIIDYYLPNKLDSTKLELNILKGSKVVRSYSNQKPKNFKTWPGGPSKPMILPSKKGFNRISWDLRRASVPAVDKVFVLGDYSGGLLPPGTYTAQLILGDRTLEAPIVLKADPLVKASEEDYKKQDELLGAIQNSLVEVHDKVNLMRKVQSQLQHHLDILKEMNKYEELRKEGELLVEKLTKWEQQLIQPQQKTFQDVINFKNMLNAEYMHLKSYVDGSEPEVTNGAMERFNDLEAQWKNHRETLNGLINKEIKSFNQSFEAENIPALWMKE